MINNWLLCSLIYLLKYKICSQCDSILYTLYIVPHAPAAVKWNMLQVSVQQVSNVVNTCTGADLGFSKGGG